MGEALTEQEWRVIETRLDTLMAEVNARVERAALLANAWLDGRQITTKHDWLLPECVADGWSLHLHGFECIATWAPGPRRLRDPDVALVTARRYPAASPGHFLQRAAKEACEARGIPVVEIASIFPPALYWRPENLVRAYESSQALVTLREADGIRRGARALVWDWSRGVDHPDAATIVAGAHIARIWDGAIYADESCLVVRASERERTVLLSARRYQVGTFRRLVRDALREVLGSYDLDVREVRPAGADPYAAPEHLIKAWREGERARSSRLHLTD